MYDTVTHSPKPLVVGAFPAHREKVMIKSGSGDLTAGMMLGEVTDGGADDGNFAPLDSAANNGLETFAAVLANDVSVDADDDTPAVALFTGALDKGQLTVKGGGAPSVAQLRAARRMQVFAKDVIDNN
jgi:hypothetical protein